MADPLARHRVAGRPPAAAGQRVPVRGRRPGQQARHAAGGRPGLRGLRAGQLLRPRPPQALGTGPLQGSHRQDADGVARRPASSTSPTTALQTGDVDTREVFRSVSIPADESLYGYPADLKEVIDAQAKQLNDEASQRQQWYLALAGAGRRRGPGRHLAGVPLDHPAPAVADPPGQGDGRAPAARRRARHPRDAARRQRRGTRDRAGLGHTPATRSPTWPTPSTPCRTRRSTWPSSRPCCGATSPTRFVNLGRRNQNLLGRQLDFITELESNETDPDTLASLFRLDHLATRMRRNAESLLVLAGIDPPRKWAAPVRLTDVIRAALGEVEDYQRVTVRGRRAGDDPGLGRRRPRPPHRRVHRERPHVLPARPERRHPGPQPPRRLHAGHHRLGPRHAGRRHRPGQPPPRPAPRASRSPPRSTWATTSPATWPPATASTSTWRTRPATASPPPSTCRRRC